MCNFGPQGVMDTRTLSAVPVYQPGLPFLSASNSNFHCLSLKLFLTLFLTSCVVQFQFAFMDLSLFISISYHILLSPMVIGRPTVCLQAKLAQVSEASSVAVCQLSALSVNCSFFRPWALFLKLRVVCEAFKLCDSYFHQAFHYFLHFSL